MGLTNFGVKKYASLEMNRAAYLKNGLVVSQLPLASAFTEESPCENGMWVDAEKAKGEITAPTANTKTYGIVYTTEKEYNDGFYGLKHFHQVGGQYPRVGILHNGDTFTTNCFQYDTSTWANDAAVISSANAVTTTALYLKPTASNGRPTLTASAPTGGIYGRVIKATTMPNGEPAIKYDIVEA